jgi:hypothetical protein
MLLNNGELMAVGAPTEVVSLYEEITDLKFRQGRQHISHLGVLPGKLSTDGKEENPGEDEIEPVMAKVEGSQIEIIGVYLYNQKGEKTDVFYTGETMYGEIEYKSDVAIEDAIVGLLFSTLDRMAIFAFTNDGLDFPLSISQHGCLKFKIDPVPLLKGRYTMKLKIKKLNEAPVGGGLDIKTFRVIVPGEIRLSSDYGIIKANSSWLLPESPFPFEAE